jgi:PAS domain S-box-containing protein
MQESIFDRRVDPALRHVEVLWQRARTSGEPAELVEEALERLSSAVHELQAAGEELRQQNEELASAHAMIEAERQRYQELFEFAPDGYLVTDAKGTIQDASLKAANLLQVSKKFLMGMPLLVFVDEIGYKAFTALLSRLQKGEEVQEWELRLRPHMVGLSPPLWASARCAIPQAG